VHIACVRAVFINISFNQIIHWIKTNIFLIATRKPPCFYHNVQHTMIIQGSVGYSPASLCGCSGFILDQSIEKLAVIGFYPSTSVFSYHSFVIKTEVFCVMVGAIDRTVATSVIRASKLHILYWCFNLIQVSSTCFEHPSVHPQEDLYMKFYGMFPCVYISSLVDVRMCVILTLTRLHIWMHERNSIKLQVQVFLRVNTWIYKTRRRHFKLNH
jgi:hypothetical protein